MLTSSADLVRTAAAGGVGVAAFNGITIEHGEAIVAGAEAARRPVIVALSHNAVRFHGGLRPMACAYRALAEQATVPVGLHLDHVEDLDLVRQAPGLGFGSVMFDAARLPYADNVAATREAAAVLHDAGLWLEAELGEIAGKGGAHAAHMRTDPGEAAQFVDDTRVDALAVAVGTSHAMTDRSAEVDFDLLARLRAAVPVPLVLHGSSGVSDDRLRAAVLAGLVKVNIGTQLNIAYSDAVRRGAAAAPGPDPRPWLADARTAMAATVTRLLAVVAGGSATG